MSLALSLLSGFFSGLIGAMGMGGGAVLIIYLTVFRHIGRFKAQGINLLFFIPIAAVAVFIYARRGGIKFKTVLPFAAFGIIGALGGIFIASFSGVRLVSKVFGAALIILGLKEIYGTVKSLLARKRNKCYTENEKE